MHTHTHHNPHRRVFRGRAGPTDRRLPKYNARVRRKAPSAAAVVVGNDEPDHVVHQEDDHNDHDNHNDHDDSSDHLGEDRVGAASSLPSLSSFEQFHEKSKRSLEQTFQEAKQSAKKETVVANDDEDHNDDAAEDKAVISVSKPAETDACDPSQACKQELQHLCERMQKLRQAMQLSSSSSSKEAASGGGGAFAIPSNYQRHVLGAVHNVVIEWKAILRHYPAEIIIMISSIMEHHHHHHHNNNNDDNDDNLAAKSIGLALFELIQQALQCGPLSGAKPGYFKRCGSDVAQMVYDFLNRLLLADPNHHDNDDEKKEEEDDSSSLYLTEKQVHAIEKWKQAAKKAAEKEALPSKTAALQQQRAQQNVNKKREQKAKKYQ